MGCTTFHGIAGQSAWHSNICWKDKQLSLHWEVWAIGKSPSVTILWISSASLRVCPSPLLESSSESECESDEDSTCSSSSDSEVFDVIAEIKRKKAHPDRLHDELWYNDPGQVRMCFMFLLGRVQTTRHIYDSRSRRCMSAGIETEFSSGRCEPFFRAHFLQLQSSAPKHKHQSNCALNHFWRRW